MFKLELLEWDEEVQSILFHPSNLLMNFKVIFQVQLALVLESTLLIMAQLSVRGSGMRPCL